MTVPVEPAGAGPHPSDHVAARLGRGGHPADFAREVSGEPLAEVGGRIVGLHLEAGVPQPVSDEGGALEVVAPRRVHGGNADQLAGDLGELVPTRVHLPKDPLFERGGHRVERRHREARILSGRGSTLPA